MKLNNKNNFIQQRKQAQGTIEYLVIIGIVVVIGLVVVGMLVGLVSSNSGTGDKANQIKQYTQSTQLKALNGIVDSNQGVLVLKNTFGSGTVTVKSITVSDPNSTSSIVSSGYTSNNKIAFTNSANFSVSSFSTGCPCSDGMKERTCRVSINYLDNYDLNRTETMDTSVSCVSSVQVASNAQVVWATSGDSEPAIEPFDYSALTLSSVSCEAGAYTEPSMIYTCYSVPCSWSFNIYPYKSVNDVNYYGAVNEVSCSLESGGSSYVIVNYTDTFGWDGYKVELITDSYYSLAGGARHFINTEADGFCWSDSGGHCSHSNNFDIYDLNTDENPIVHTPNSYP
jgi:hypothetical protein